MTRYFSKIDCANIPETLSPGANRVLKFIAKADSISAREAMIDLDMAQGTLTKNICRIEDAGYRVVRKVSLHPVTRTRYTRYYVHDTEKTIPYRACPYAESV